MNRFATDLRNLCHFLQLERECVQLRSELQQNSALNQVTTETSEQMLERIRSDQQRQDESALKARNEMERLRQVHQTTLVSRVAARLPAMRDFD